MDANVWHLAICLTDTSGISSDIILHIWTVVAGASGGREEELPYSPRPGLDVTVNSSIRLQRRGRSIGFPGGSSNDVTVKI